MCDPVTMGVIVASTSAISAGLAFGGKQEERATNIADANAGYANTFNSIQTQAGELDTQRSENAVTAMINAAASRGHISASASSMGADAATTTAMANAGDFDVGRDLSLKNVNTENQRVQLGQNLKDASLRRQSQINQTPAPSVAGLLLNIAGAGIKGANSALHLAGT